MDRFQLVKHTGLSASNLEEYGVYRVVADDENPNIISSVVDILPVELSGSSPAQVKTLLQKIQSDLSTYPVVTSCELDELVFSNSSVLPHWDYDEEDQSYYIEPDEEDKVVDLVDFFNRNQ